MIIALSPQRRDAPLAVSRAGDVLTINGAAYDFAPLAEGDTLPAEAVDCEFIGGDVSRIGGKLRLTLTLPHGPNPPPHVAFPADIVDPPDGAIALPGGAA